MERRNITLSLPKDVLQKAKHIAVDKNTSVSGLLTKALEELVNKEKSYQKACSRQLVLLGKGFNLGLEGSIPWEREDVHERKR